MDPLAALKLMPCPKGAACTAFQCLFRHPGDDNMISSTENDVPRPPLAPTRDIRDPQDTPRKRLKVTSDDSLIQRQAISSPPITHIKTKPEDRHPTIQTTDASSTRLATRDKPVSPPPLSRSPHPSTTQKTTPTGRAKTTERLAPGSKATPPPPASQTLRKVETLNPRHIQKAPAQHELRLKLVKALYEQYKRLNCELKADAKDDEERLVLTDQQLIVRTLDEEQEIATKKPAVYANAIKNKIMQYKRMTVVQWKEERSKLTKADPVDAKPDPSEPIVTGLTEAQEVRLLSHLASPLDNYAKYGYVSQPPTDSEVEAVAISVEASGNTELCDRNGCGRRFQVFPGRREEDGALASNGSCVHHPGKVYTLERSSYDRTSKLQRKYRCCQTDLDDADAEKGCTTAPTHVFKASDPKRLASVLQFAKTPVNDAVPADRAVAFDCEMGYTVYGMELIRLTVVSWPDGKELLDILVQPYGEVLDLNTRYSGVRPEDMANAVRWKQGEDPGPVAGTDGKNQRRLKLVPSPKAARDLMFSLISPQTPVIGHALENDLNAVRMVHPTVVDTVLLYPHRRGLPLRYGLKYLMDHHLGRKIQTSGDSDSDVVGHDSAEDARAAGDLVRLKVREEWKKMQVDGWTLDAETDTFIAPPATKKL